MSRVGKKFITIPKGVEVKIEKGKILIKGPKGELSQEIRREIEVSLKEDKLFITPKIKIKKTGAFWGTTRALLFNMVKGVTDGFEKKLEIKGIGFKVNLEGEDLVLQVGFSHPVKMKKIEGIKFIVEKNIIIVSGFDKQLVGETAAKIRRIRPPDAYKDKGIRYLGEVIKLKEGKKVVSSTGA
ncbi:MAG: 50S ribosomal protein L6 [Candidatus Nealsonbacteria bacterium]|nr:50S ribosomal protein L6 [Candidatus Nealsonbacteria bacterium]